MTNIVLLKDRLSITTNGFTLIEFQQNIPSIYLGKAIGTYKMSHGSFKIKENIIEYKALKTYSIIEQKEKSLILIFEDILQLSINISEPNISLDFNLLTPEYNRFKINIKAVKGESIYGLGEQFTYVDFKGKNVPLWCEEQGVGRGKDLITLLADIKYGAGGNWHSTYFPQPTFISSENYFAHIETSSYCEFDFRKHNEHTLYCWEVPARIILSKQTSIQETINCLTTYLGKQQALPDWIFDGVLLGIQGGKTIVDKKLKTAFDFHLPVSGIWCQDWEGVRYTSFGKQLFWNWEYDNKLYPELPTYIKELNEKNIKFTGYINHFLALEGQLYQEAAKKNYCVKNNKGKDYNVYITSFPAAVLDLTNPEAVRWIKEIIKTNMLNIGLSGWMADFGEHLPTDSVLHSGINAERYHNQYPVDWIKTNRDAIAESGKQDDILYFARAGYTGTQNSSQMIWAGDQLVNWSKDDGLPTVIPAAISMGFSGIGYHHSDIGGYTTVLWIKRKKELFLRWTEQATFSIMMRTHEGNRPGDNWQFDSDTETLKHFSRFVRIHKYLKPYLKHTAQEYLLNGMPVMRHPLIHYQNDINLLNTRYQYMLGSELFVAPVLWKSIKTMSVYLPKGEWVHLFSQKDYKGGKKYNIDCPIGVPPVFYRKFSEFKTLFNDIAKIL